MHLAMASTVEAQTAEEGKVCPSESWDQKPMQMPASLNLAVNRNINLQVLIFIQVQFIVPFMVPVLIEAGERSLA